MTEQEKTFFEDLEIEGLTCPHKDAFIPNGDKKLYRKIKFNPPTSECFVSHRKMNPEKLFSNVDECLARAVSAYDSIEGLFNAYFKTPAGKKRKALVCELVLNEKDGMLKQTFRDGHYSWWRSQSFDINSVSIQKVEA